MKKILSIFILIYSIVNSSFAQSNFKPSFQVVAKGIAAFPMDKYGFGSAYYTSPGGQLEVTYKLKPLLGFYANFTYDIFAPKPSTSLRIGAINYSTSHQYTGSAGLKFYFTKSLEQRFFVDLGLGYYSFSQGDTQEEYEVPGSKFSSTSYTAYPQTGLSFGSGADFPLTKKIFLNFGIKYHLIFERANATLTSSSFIYYNNSTYDRTYSFRAPSRTYFQFAAGIGYNF